MGLRGRVAAGRDRKLELRDQQLKVEVPKAHSDDPEQLGAALGGVRSR